MTKLAASPKNIKRVRNMRAERPELLGPKFGLLIYASNVPASAVAQHLDITEASLYRWMFGSRDISKDNRPKVLAAGKKLSEAVKQGKLPVFGDLNDRRKALLSVLQDC